MADNFDNYGMKVRATVDMPSVGDIDKQIRKLEKSISKLQVSGKLDDASLKSLSHQLDTLKATVTTANFSTTALSELTNQVEKALGNVQLSGSLAKIGRDISSSISQGVKQSIDTTPLLESQNKLQNELKETDKSVQKVLYHFGELTKLGEQSAKSRTLGKGNSNSNYASLNSLTGLYLTDKKNELLEKTMSSSQNKYTGADISTIDISGYNLFIAETDEIAEKIKLFFSQIGELTSQLHRSEDTTKTIPSDLKIETVYAQMNELFGDISLTYEQFENFIKNCRNIVSKYNLNDFLNPTNFKGNELPEEIRNMDSFQTQIMKMLGFEGLDLSKTSSYSGTNNVGTVVFDIGKDRIVEVKTYTEAVEELAKTKEKTSTSTTNTVVQNEERKQQAIQETLSLEEQSEKIKELAVKKANERKEVNNLRKEIEEETGVKVNVSDVRQAQKEVEKANKAQQEGTKENIKLREQELAHTKMLAKQTKANADLLDAQKKEELVQTKANNKEEIEGLKQERLLMEENAKRSSAISKQKVAETKAEANEQKALQTSLNTPEKEIKRKLDNDVYTTDIDKLEKKFVDYGLTIEQAKEKVSSLRNDLKELNKLSGDELIKKANDWESAFEKVEVQLEQTKLSYKDLEKLNKIQHSLSIGDYDTQLKSYSIALQKVGIEGDELKIKLKGASDALKELKTSTSGDDIISSEVVARADALANEFEKLANVVKNVKLDNSLIADDIKVNDSITKLNEQLRKNGNYASSAKDKICEWIKELESGDVAEARLKAINSEAKKLHSEMAQLGKIGKSKWQTFTEGLKSFTEWATASGAVMEVVQAVKTATQNVIKLDDQLLELSKVSDLSADGLTKITEEAYKLGDTVGKTGTQVLEAITTFKRAGFELADSTALAETAMKMVNVAEGIDDASESAQYLISIMKGYGDTSTEFATKILDSVNEVSNTQSVDFDNLVDGGQRLSAVANQAGVSFDQMLGVLTGGYEVLGNMEKTASGLITIFTRLQSIQLADEEEVESVAKLQETFSKATKGRVNIVNQTTGQLRGAYDILNDLNDVWNELDKNTQEGLAFAAGGTRQKSVFLSIMSNWKSVEKSVQSATNSMGSAEEENSKYLESLSGKIIILESAIEKLSNTVLNSELLKFFVDLGTIGVNAVNGIVTGFEKVNTLFGLLGDNNIGGTLGAISGLIMNLTGVGERTKFQW